MSMVVVLWMKICAAEDCGEDCGETWVAGDIYWAWSLC